ncbi:hypothetical protein, partial [Plebeiibacterium sediminum]
LLINSLLVLVFMISFLNSAPAPCISMIKVDAQTNQVFPFTFWLIYSLSFIFNGVHDFRYAPIQ